MHDTLRAWLKVRDGRGTKKEKTGCRPRFSRLAASPLNARARALPLLNLKKKRDCSQSTLSSLLLSTASSNRPKLLNYLPTFLQV